MSFKELTEIQKSIVEAPFGPMLVTAGAGSGKTRVLTHRLVHLIQGGIPDTAIAALTFTNKAANEMKKRVEDMLGCQCNTFLGTFHSFCARFLRRNIQHLAGFDSNFSIYNTSDTQKVIKEILAANSFSHLDKEKGVKKVEWHLSNMKNAGMTPKRYHDDIMHMDEADDIMRVIDAYKTRLESNNALDFDDLLLKTLEIFDTCPAVLAAMQQRLNYILVDEFQDTNIIQYKIVSRLAAIHKNIMVVGDEDQCIYTWRGASIENIELFRRDFEGAKIYKLEENFRSSKNIVNLANKLVAHNDKRLNKVLFSELPDGIINLEQCWNEKDEATRVASAIVTLMRQDTNLKYSNFAILMRINALSRVFEEQLLAYNIPHVIWGGFKFYERSEIKSAINYLRLLVNPKDEVALFDVINFPRRGIGDVSIEKIKELAQGSASQNGEKTCFDVVMNIDNYKDHFSKKALAGIKSFVFVINALSELHNSFGLYELAGNLIGTIGLDAVYKDTKNEDDFSRLENLYQLEHAIKTFAGDNPTATLSQYLQSVSLISDIDMTSGDARNSDAVVISTVHSAKGLEFKNVFVVGLEDGLFPLSRSKNNPDEIEEERRLLYVAITRAEERLNLSYCGSRFLQGERRSSLPSLFLKEAGFEIKRSFDFSDDNFNSSHSGQQYTNHNRDKFNQRDEQRHSSYDRMIEKISTEKVIEAKSDTAETLDMDAGTRVRHEKFGDGTVVDVIDKNIVKIKFDIAGIKMLSLAFATIKKI